MNLRRYSYMLFVCALLGAALAVAGEPSVHADDTLALVGSRVITAGSFIKSYGEHLVKIGITDNVDTRMGYLDNLVRDEVLILQAKRQHFDDTPPARAEFSRIRQQELLNAYSQRHIVSAVKVTDDELKEFFILLNTKFKVRHLYAPTKEKADALYAQLRHGKTFADLAKTIFADPQLRDTGGLLGYIEVDEMDAEFEKAAFGLKVGEISRPVKTVQGYSIIKLEDIKRNPFVTDYEFGRSKERLAAFVRKRKSEEAAKRFTAQVRDKMKISVDADVCRRVYAVLYAAESSKDPESHAKTLSNKDSSRIIVRTATEQWTVLKLLKAMTGTFASQRKWIHNEENFEDYVSGIVLRAHLVAQAEKERMDAPLEFRRTLEYKFDTYLSDAVEKKMMAAVAITDDSLIAYYRKNKGRFAQPAQMRLSSLLLEEKDRADSVKSILRHGESFETAARMYSRQTATAEHGGDMGYFRKDELGTFGGVIFALRKGEWTGPLTDEGKYLFVKCTEVKDVTYTPFEQAKEDIRSTLIHEAWYAMRDSHVAQLKKSMHCRIYPERVIPLIISHQ